MPADFARPAWPAGHRAALCLTIDVDGPYGELNYRPDDQYWVSQTAYDPVGVVRLLDLLGDTGVHATFPWVGRAALDHPDLVKRAVDEGHEIALHSWEHRAYDRMTVDEQREDMTRSLQALSEVSGTRPTGHKTASWRFGPDTHQLALDLGLQWVMDVPDGDVPSVLARRDDGTPLVNLPPSWIWDDYTWFVDRIATPQQVFEAWREDLDVARTEGGMVNLTVHPFVSGRPGPSRAIARILDYAIDVGDIWIARADQLAGWWIERDRDERRA